ncbi:DUF2510 domain-containing protein [Nocardioides sp. GY 10113]|uniref:DUF2510 domain-containing protein n=1 Tax=Nocardioides sp. GY 10113 TaxID=2569761 RepID=UPI0010A84BD7|nr:DUF2510 domain-containing protein [Nocardioides sp. GY 10113]TIC85079.1 DUF2510 domain-containing protein [Nocardioides sp. GY 10113]
MTNAGWYPDPAGTPDTYRYWDGQAWSHQTTTDPYGAARAAQPVPPAPQAPPAVQSGPSGYPQAGQPGHHPQAGQPGHYPQRGYPQHPGHLRSGHPQQPGHPQQWPPSPRAGAGGADGSRRGLVVGLVVCGVAFLVVLAVLSFLVVRAITEEGTRPRSAGAPLAPTAVAGPLQERVEGELTVTR